MRITVKIQYQDSERVHTWLDQHFPGWDYLGSQFYLGGPDKTHAEVCAGMTKEELHDLYKRQRVHWGTHFPRQGVTQHFEVGDISPQKLALLNQNFIILAMWEKGSPQPLPKKKNTK